MKTFSLMIFIVIFATLTSEDESYSIKSKRELLDATQKIGKWKRFCEFLGVSEGVLEELDDSIKSVSEKKYDCLTDYFKNHNPNWRKVVSVVANFPIRNLREACKIAKKYMKMEKKECEKQFKPEDEDSIGDAKLAKTASPGSSQGPMSLAVMVIVLLLLVGPAIGFLCLKGKANATPIPEPADGVDRDGSIRVDTSVAMRTQVSPFGHVGPAKHIQVPLDHGGGGDRAGHIQVPPDYGGGGGGGNRAGRTQIPVGRADGNETSLIRHLIPKVGGADKISESADRIGSIQEPAYRVDISIASCTQVSPVGRVDRAEHIQVPPDNGDGGGDRAGHIQVSDDIDSESPEIKAVKTKIEDLENYFSKLARSLMAELRQNKIPVETVIDLCSNVPISMNAEGVIDALEDKELEKNKTLSKLFRFLGTYVWNFIDYHLLRFIIFQLGSEGLQQCMKEYGLKLQEFRRSTFMFTFMQSWPGRLQKLENYDEVITTFDRDAQSCTIENIDQFRCRLQEQLMPSLSKFCAILYYKHKNGCFVVTWILPQDCADTLKKIILANPDFLQEHFISSILIRNDQVYPPPASADPVDENTPGDYIDCAECRDDHADGKSPVEGPKEEERKLGTDKFPAGTSLIQREQGSTIRGYSRKAFERFPEAMLCILGITIVILSTLLLLLTLILTLTPTPTPTPTLDPTPTPTLNPTLTPTLMKVVEEHRQAFNKIIQESSTINVTVMRFVHIGLPRAGKTTTQRRLLGKMLDILSTQGDGKNPPSTVIESYQATIGSIESENWSISMNLKEEAEILLTHFFPRVNVSSTKSSLPPQSLKNSLITPAADEEYFSLFKKVIEERNGTDWSNKRSQPIDDRILLFNADIGGQPEYIDLIAPLVVGPSLNFLYHRLNEPLDKEYDIVYTDNEGNSTTPQKSTITVQDFLFQSLSAIESFSERALTHQSTSINSNVILVGTFRDKVSEDEVKKRSDLLWKKIKSSYYKHMVQEIFPTKYILDVNNYNGSREGIYRIRNVLSEIFRTKYTSKVQLPVQWLILSLYMRMRKEPMMTFKECKKLVEGLYISSTILKEALWYFHHNMGIILYYEDLDMVISNVNILFDSIKELITSMKSFNVVREGAENFISMAIFSERNVNATLTKQSNNTIPFHTLVKLLQHLNILTVTEAFSEEYGREEGDNIIYFMPSLLQLARADELDIRSKDSDPAHLLVCFKSGYVPVGVFSLMIVSLESQKLNGWTLDKSNMKKNKLGFKMKCNNKITFIARPKYIEIVISMQPSHCVTSTESLCGDILSVIDYTLRSVTSNMKLDFNFGFKNLDFPKDDYLCTYYNGEVDIGLECQHPQELMDYRSFQPLNWRQEVWFKPEPASSLNGGSSSSFQESISHNPAIVAMILAMIALLLLLFVSVAFLYKANATSIPEPAGRVDRDGSNRVTSTRPQVSPVGRVDRAEHIQVPPDHGGGGDGGNRAGHTQVPVHRADGNGARKRISKVGGADKNSELSDLLEKIDDTQLGHPAIEDDLADVLDALSDLEAKWRMIGTNLRLRNSFLDTIKADDSGVQSRLHSAITEWLRLNYNYRENGVPSWRMLAKAVYRLDRSVFNRIAEEHPALYLPRRRR